MFSHITSRFTFSIQYTPGRFIRLRLLALLIFIDFFFSSSRGGKFIWMFYWEALSTFRKVSSKYVTSWYLWVFNFWAATSMNNFLRGEGTISHRKRLKIKRKQMPSCLNVASVAWQKTFFQRKCSIEIKVLPLLSIQTSGKARKMKMEEMKSSMKIKLPPFVAKFLHHFKFRHSLNVTF